MTIDTRAAARHSARQFTGGLTTLSLCLAVGFFTSCKSGVTATPTTPTITPTAATPSESLVTVFNISPHIGTTDGATPVLISGRGFEAGAAVTLDGAAVDVTVLSETAMTATTSAHAAGRVDVVVTNPGGRSGRLIGGYTYALIAGGLPPLIASVSPSVGTRGGGGSITIRGDGFEPGVIVKFDSTPLTTFRFGANSTTLHAQAPAHVVGSVDVIVVNPDGQATTLRGGYKYAEMGSLDFSGNWKGVADDLKDNHGSTEVRFTFETNMLTSVSCNSETLTVSPPLSVVNDEFTMSKNGRHLVSGRFLSAGEARGTINFPPCGFGWSARKQ